MRVILTELMFLNKLSYFQYLNCPVIIDFRYNISDAWGVLTLYNEGSDHTNYIVNTVLTAVTRHLLTFYFLKRILKKH